MQRRVARTYQEYVEDKKRKGEKPLGKPEWEARQNGRSEDSKGQGKNKPSGDGGGPPKGKKPESLPSKSIKTLKSRMQAAVGKVKAAVAGKMAEFVENSGEAGEGEESKDERKKALYERTDAAFGNIAKQGWSGASPKDRRVVTEFAVDLAARVAVGAGVFAAIPLGGVAGGLFSAFVASQAMGLVGRKMEKYRSRKMAANKDVMKQLGDAATEAFQEALEKILAEMPVSEEGGEKEEKKAARRVASLWMHRLRHNRGPWL